MEWNEHKEDPFDTFMSETCHSDFTYWEKRDDVETQPAAVQARVLNLQWIYNGKLNFVAFSAILQELPNSVYSSEFVSYLLEENWPELQRQIKRWYFYPFLMYVLLSIVYMKMALSPDSESYQDE